MNWRSTWRSSHLPHPSGQRPLHLSAAHAPGCRRLSARLHPCCCMLGFSVWMYTQTRTSCMELIFLYPSPIFFFLPRFPLLPNSPDLSRICPLPPFAHCCLDQSHHPGSRRWLSWPRGSPSRCVSRLTARAETHAGSCDALHGIFRQHPLPLKSCRNSCL